MKKTKYIFVSGGVISGVGKGTITASLSRLLENQGYKVSPIKVDMYLNVDAGTIRPQEHGEVFVLDDGLECDQDLGNYERFLNRSLSRINYMTSGAVYYSVITKERAFKYEGEDVETIPHVTNEIIERIENTGQKDRADIVIIELGGTVGEYQNAVFFEANRLLKMKNPQDVIHIHVAYLITPPSLGEMKTKPVQQSVHTLNSMGIQPDFVVTRSEQNLDEPRRKKISLFCGVKPSEVIASPDIDSIYKVPQVLAHQKMDLQIMAKLGLKPNKNKTNAKLAHSWQKLVNNIDEAKKTSPVKIGIIGKYFRIGSFSLSDVYISVIEAIKHAGWHFAKNIELVWIDGEEIEKGHTSQLADIKGMIVPGGFGTRGIEGIIKAIRYAREHKIPYLGLCYGMQLATIEFARHVAGIKNANTAEINPKCQNPVIHIMPEQEKKLLAQNYGGSMRLGAFPAKLKKGTKAYQAYGKTNLISERHRHRFEFNNQYREILEKNGLIFSGTSPDGRIMEIIELKGHPFFVACQFHPELKSSPLTPHPLFKEFIKNCL
jgi:CTP synthase